MTPIFHFHLEFLEKVKMDVGLVKMELPETVVFGQCIMLKKVRLSVKIHINSIKRAAAGDREIALMLLAMAGYGEGIDQAIADDSVFIHTMLKAVTGAEGKE